MNRPVPFNKLAAGLILALGILPLATFAQINCSDAGSNVSDEASPSAEAHFDRVMAGLKLEDQIEMGVLPEKPVVWESFAPVDDFVPVDFVSGQLRLLSVKNAAFDLDDSKSVFFRLSGPLAGDRVRLISVAMLLPGFMETSTAFTVSPAIAAATAQFARPLTPASGLPVTPAEIVSAFPSTVRAIFQDRARDAANR